MEVHVGRRRRVCKKLFSICQSTCCLGCGNLSEHLLSRMWGVVLSLL